MISFTQILPLLYGFMWFSFSFLCSNCSQSHMRWITAASRCETPHREFSVMTPLWSSKLSRAGAETRCESRAISLSSPLLIPNRRPRLQWCSNWSKNRLPSVPRCSLSLSRFSFHPANKAECRNDQNNPVTSFIWISFAIDCLRFSLEVNVLIPAAVKGAADYISPGNNHSSPLAWSRIGTAAFCRPARPLPSVQHLRSAANQMLLHSHWHI